MNDETHRLIAWIDEEPARKKFWLDVAWQATEAYNMTSEQLEYIAKYLKDSVRDDVPDASVIGSMNRNFINRSIDQINFYLVAANLLNDLRTQ